VNLGRISQLLHVDARAWRAPLALGLTLAALQWLASVLPASFPYDRAAILAGGQYWRLLTAHLVHHDFNHLAWNLAGLALVAWLFAREFTLRGWIVILGVSTLAVDLGFLVFEPQLQWYVGFSGVLHGCMAAGLVAWLRRERDALTVIVAALFAAKLSWEHAVGPLPFTAGTLSLPVIHEAHTYGAVGGALAALWLLRRRPPAAAPL
jgi:rhomboid family GlyGly-CTERM serine protease